MCVCVCVRGLGDGIAMQIKDDFFVMWDGGWRVHAQLTEKSSDFLALGW